MTLSYTITTSEPVNQQIYRYLRKDIVTCVIQPGALLSEKEVSARFHLSRQPVREAFIAGRSRSGTNPSTARHLCA